MESEYEGFRIRLARPDDVAQICGAISDGVYGGLHDYFPPLVASWIAKSPISDLPGARLAHWESDDDDCEDFEFK